MRGIDLDALRRSEFAIESKLSSDSGRSLLVLLGLDRTRIAQAVALAVTPNIALHATRRGNLSMWKGVAAGNAGVAFDPTRTDIHMQGVLVCKAGLAAPFSEQEMEKLRKDVSPSREGLEHNLTGHFDGPTATPEIFWA